ncbi:MAG: hypothetical protein V3R35_06100 [Woeseiaceae bacterium]|jgi:hypothetical protein
MSVKATTVSVGAQLSMMRKRSKKTCKNLECSKKFVGLTITNYCSDAYRFRAGYLRRSERLAQ